MAGENEEGAGMARADSLIDGLLEKGIEPGAAKGCAWKIAAALLAAGKPDLMVHSKLMSNAPLQQKFWDEFEQELQLASPESRARLLVSFCKGWRQWEIGGTLLPDESERHECMFRKLCSGLDAAQVLAKATPPGKGADWWALAQIMEPVRSAKERQALQGAARQAPALRKARM